MKTPANKLISRDVKAVWTLHATGISEIHKSCHAVLFSWLLFVNYALVVFIIELNTFGAFNFGMFIDT